MLELIDDVEISETELDAIEALEMQRTRRSGPAPLPGTCYDYEGIAEAEAVETRQIAIRWLAGCSRSGSELTFRASPTG